MRATSATFGSAHFRLHPCLPLSFWNFPRLFVYMVWISGGFRYSRRCMSFGKKKRRGEALLLYRQVTQAPLIDGFLDYFEIRTLQPMQHQPIDSYSWKRAQAHKSYRPCQVFLRSLLLHSIPWWWEFFECLQWVLSRRKRGGTDEGNAFMEATAAIHLFLDWFCRGVETAHMQEEWKDWTEVVLYEATDRLCRYVTANSNKERSQTITKRDLKPWQIWSPHVPDKGTSAAWTKLLEIRAGG